MIVAYKVVYRCFSRGELVQTFTTNFLKEKLDLEELKTSFSLDWETLEDNLPLATLFISIKDKRKGRKVSFCPSLAQPPFKEWNEDLEITIEREYIEYEPSLQEILHNSQTEMAIQYLHDRGLIFG